MNRERRENSSIHRKESARDRDNSSGTGSRVRASINNNRDTTPGKNLSKLNMHQSLSSSDTNINMKNHA